MDETVIHKQTLDLMSVWREEKESPVIELQGGGLKRQTSGLFISLILIIVLHLLLIPFCVTLEFDLNSQALI